MALIHNNENVPNDYCILQEKWKLKSVYGEELANKPGYCIFNNSSKALELLDKHIKRNSSIVFHTDVDVDGIGTTYIFKKTLESLGSNKHTLLINQNKVHGIHQRHVNYFKENKIDLLIVTDSSSNEIELIKQFNCDVLVIDHHDLLNNDLSGKCSDGIHEYVIVNNTIDNYSQELDEKWLREKRADAFENIEQYHGDNDMSCGLVVYELLRLYCVCIGKDTLLENLLLFQWVGVTLLTDVINTLNDRNQWYLDKTVFNNDMESTLGIMMHNINKFKATLDKTYINYSFAPMINKAIRAGESRQALSLVMNNPQDITKLDVYKQMQQEAIDKAVYVNVGGIKSPKTFSDEYIILDITQLNINPNYSGVIAGRLGGEHNKNAAVFTVLPNGKCKGSFRGRYKEVNYRKYFTDYATDIYAQGHPPAFGFELYLEQLEDIMRHLPDIEPTSDNKVWLTAGNMPLSERGIYHIDNMDEFKRLGYLVKIATGNAKVVSSDEITIRVPASDVVLKDITGKVYKYSVLGLECKAFSNLVGDYFDIYCEYTNQIELFIR